MLTGGVQYSQLGNETFILPLQSLNVQLELCYLPLWVMGQLGLLRGGKGRSRLTYAHAHAHWNLFSTLSMTHLPEGNTLFHC